MQHETAVLTTTNDREHHDDQDEIPAWARMLAQHLLQRRTMNTVDERLYQRILALGAALARGDTCLIEQRCDSDISDPLVVSGDAAQQTPKPLVVELADTQQYWYFYRHWQQEHTLAERLAALLDTQHRPASVPVAFSADDPLNQLQREALIRAASMSFTLITGGPGTGKTFTLARIVKLLQADRPDLRVALAAPTGKAAQRMQSVLSAAFLSAGIGAGQIQSAQTLHRLLGLGMQSKARYDRFEPLPYDLIVIDEGSMLDLALASQLFEAIAPGTRVIILGDADQLAAVDAGAVLADLGATPLLAQHRIHLAESRRFHADRGIGRLAAAVLEQQPDQVIQALQGSDEVTYQALKTIPLQQVHVQLWQGYQAYLHDLRALSGLVHPLPSARVEPLLKAFDRFRILCAQRHGSYGVQAINRAMDERLQQALGVHPIGPWYHGRPVMITRNDYSLQLSNGDIGLCLMDVAGQAWVYFPERTQPIAALRLPPEQVETAFALTIHKSQGSEFETVAMLLDEAAMAMLSRELVYTAITRAKSAIQVWADQSVLLAAVAVKGSRISGLRFQLARQLESMAKG